MSGLAIATAAVFAIAAAIVVAVTSSDSTTSLVDLAPATCVELPDDPGVGPIEELQEIDCAEPHLAEVVAVGTLGSAGREYPSDDELFAEVDRACRAADPVASDAFGLLPVAPTEALWESFDGRYLCIAIPFGGEPVTGSLLDE